MGAAAELMGMVTDGVVAGGDIVTGAHLAGRDDHRFPLLPAFDEVLPGGLSRGRTLACRGDAAVSVALALCAGATQAGSWLALVGVPWVGVEAARELGVALERTVAVDVCPDDVGQWAERVAAAVDGFDLVLTRIPPRAGDRMLRRVGQRLTARGGVLIDVAPPGGHASVRPADLVRSADLVLGATTAGWEGIDQGSGYLRSRLVTLDVSGRRVTRPTRLECRLPGPDGALVVEEKITNGSGTFVQVVESA